MKYLLIIAHPRKESFNHAILHEVEEEIKKNGHEVVVRDLYELNFQPLLSSEEMSGQELKEDVLKEQEFLSWADVVTFIYPILWTGLPAILKGYIERVFSYGFAYKYENGVQMGQLNGKKVIIFNTQGKSFEEYQKTGMQEALRLTSDKGIFEYCGFEVVDHVFFDSIHHSDKNTRQGWLDQVSKTVSKSMTISQV